jgi:hypothetical protein
MFSIKLNYPKILPCRRKNLEKYIEDSFVVSKFVKMCDEELCLA